MRFERKYYLDELIARKHNGMIKIITGLRRSGKSYLLFELFRAHLIENGVSEEQIIAFSLENRRMKKLRNPDECLAYIDAHIKGDKMHYVMIDEVQMMAEFVDVLNSYLDMPNVDVYVTGSNSRFLVSDVVTEFRGRGDEVRVFPLSISELHEAYPEKTWDELWQEYSNFGGLPMAVLTEGVDRKKAYLKQLFRTTYFKDIVERYHIHHTEQLDQLVDFVASSVGSLTNANKLANTFQSKGDKISVDTVGQYLGYLQDAFLLNQAKRYDIRGKQYIGSPYKFYFTDIGLRNARLNFRQYEETHIMENVIYMELLRRGCEVDVGVIEVVEKVDGKNVHKRIEVDFVVNKGDRRYYIQSAYAVPDDDKMAQEERPLLKIYDSFKKIIVVQNNVLPWHNENGTLILSLKQFLTEEDSWEK